MPNSTIHYKDDYPVVELNEDKTRIRVLTIIDDTCLHTHKGSLSQMRAVLGELLNAECTNASTGVSVDFMQMFDRLVEYNTLSRQGEAPTDYMPFEIKETMDVWRKQMMEIIQRIDSIKYYNCRDLATKRRQSYSLTNGTAVVYTDTPVTIDPTNAAGENDAIAA